MKRLSLSKSKGVVAPVLVFHAVPVPRTAATPVTPRKLKIVEGSTPGPRNACSPGANPPGIGTGSTLEASASVGIQSGDVASAAAAPAVVPRNCRRDNARCQKWSWPITGRPSGYAFIPVPSSELTVTVPVVVLALTRARQSHDCRAYAEILDRARPDNAGVQGAEAHKHVSLRCLEVIEAVENEGVVCRTRGNLRRQWEHRYRECGSRASLNPVVPHYGVLREAKDPDRGAEITEDCARGRRHGDIVVHDDGALHGPCCNSAKHTDAFGVRMRPFAIDPVVRDQIRT